MISFSRPFYYWYPFPFPGYYYLRRFYVVAPYWADHDIRRDGEVCYETFQRGRTIDENIVLDKVSSYLRIRTSKSFIGTFMILAEWRDVYPYPHGSENFYYFEKYYPSIKAFTDQVHLWHTLFIQYHSQKLMLTVNYANIMFKLVIKQKYLAMPIFY